VLLAGGVGKRMKADRPKQFLELLGKPVLLHSLEIFSTLPGINRCVRRGKGGGREGGSGEKERA